MCFEFEIINVGPTYETTCFIKVSIYDKTYLINVGLNEARLQLKAY